MERQKHRESRQPRARQQRPHPRQRQPISKRRKTLYWLAAGWTLALASFGLDLGQWFRAEAASQRDLCQEVTHSTAVLSREQLAKLLAVPERSEKKNVREIVATPYCTLPQFEVRAGVSAMREAYPLAFDPDTWLVVLYEGEEYAGYGFSVQN
ncbi:MAG: hypothetical protein AAFZ80_12730 [Cyanobacteria bacterium P01_A01_bin.105]